MLLSVIIASYRSHGTLNRCLASLTAQPQAKEIIVADCSPQNPATQLAELYPGVRFLHFDTPMTIPELRWAGYAVSSGDVVACTEGRCVPGKDWCAQWLCAHADWPDCPAIGGAITTSGVISAFDAGLFFCEYGLHTPPTPELARIASGANVSYKRAALESSKDLVEQGSWETLLHERWLAQGLSIRMCPATVVFENGMSFSRAARQRFHYGRGYGADRLAGAGLGRRIFYGAGCAALPALMTARLGRIAATRSRIADFMRALPWVAALNTIWSAGEMVGYLFGNTQVRRVF